MTYIDWEYYSSLFTNVSEQEFVRYEKLAEMQIDLHTRRRAKEFLLSYDEGTATAFQTMVRDNIKITVCELINALYAQDNNAGSKGIKSVSNDGYSESYEVVTQADRDRELRNIVERGLSGTGLVGAL